MKNREHWAALAVIAGLIAFTVFTINEGEKEQVRQETACQEWIDAYRDSWDTEDEIDPDTRPEGCDIDDLLVDIVKDRD